MQNHVVSAIGRTGETDDPLDFSGFSECWFADEAQFLEALATPGWAAASVDSPNVFDESRMWGAALPGGRGEGPAARRLTHAPGARAQVVFASRQDARVRPAYGRLTVRWVRIVE